MKHDDTMFMSVCGDGAITEGEACEGTDFKGATCGSLGFDTGTLSCGATCQLDTSKCVKKCGNGMLDVGEACDGALGVSECGSFGVRRCTPTCTIDESHCVAQPFAASPPVAQTYGGPAALGDLAPNGTGDLAIINAGRARVQTYRWYTGQGFMFDRSINLPGAPGDVAVLDLNQDQTAEIITSLGADGWAISTFNGNGYTSTALGADAGCPAGRFLPRGAGAVPLFATGCDDGGTFEVVFQITAAGPTTLAAPGSHAASVALTDAGVWLAVLRDAGAVEATLWGGAGGWSAFATATATDLAAGDFDLDGDLDLVAVVPAGLELFERSTGGLLTKGVVAPGPVARPQVIDLDGDGRLDVVFAQGSQITVLRNSGALSFAPYATDGRSSLLLSLSVADLDGDGDLDIAATYVGTGTGEPTETVVVLNRVR